MSECGWVVVWDGRGSLPWQTLEDGWYHQVTRSWLERESFNYGDLPTSAETRRLRVPGAGWRVSGQGRKPSATTHDRICACGRKKSLTAPKCSGCYAGRPKKVA